MNPYRPFPAWFPHEPLNGSDGLLRADWERYTAGIPASLGLRDRGSGSLVGRGGRQLRSDRAARLWRDPVVGRLTFGHHRQARMEAATTAAATAAVLSFGAQPFAHVLRSARVRGNCLSHLDAQPGETSRRNPWVLRARRTRLR